jgi:hypothetical protein
MSDDTDTADTPADATATDTKAATEPVGGGGTHLGP